MSEPKEYGYIEATEHRNQLGNLERIDYKWIGSRLARIDRRILWSQDKDNLRIGPYKIAILGEDHWYGDYILVVRKEGLWAIPVIWHKINKVLDIIYRRTIITLAVWNLAEYNAHDLPYYGDIYIVKNIKKLVSIIQNKVFLKK